MGAAVDQEAVIDERVMPPITESDESVNDKVCTVVNDYCILSRDSGKKFIFIE